MDEPRFELEQDDQWETGFEGGRSIVVARLGPLQRVYSRPKGFVKRFYHRIHELPIQDWQLQIEPMQLGSFCTVTTAVSIRFQATERYAREHVEHLPALTEHIKCSHEPLLRDQIEEALRSLENDPRWLEQGCAAIEKTIERNLNEQLAIRNIQCRTRCVITPRFGSLAETDADSPWSRHRAIYLELLRRQRETAEQAQREEQAQALSEQRHKLEQEARLLELEREREALRKARLQQEVENLRAELDLEETLQSEQRSSETRLREEQIRHTARLRELEMDADMNEKNRRAQGMDDMEEHIKREIELLAMERQRLLLEEEVHEVKVAKAKGWVINAKRRFPLRENRNALHDSEEETPNSDDTGPE